MYHQRTSDRRQFSLSTTWIPGIKVRSLGLAGSVLLSYLAGRHFNIFQPKKNKYLLLILPSRFSSMWNWGKLTLTKCSKSIIEWKIVGDISGEQKRCCDKKIRKGRKSLPEKSKSNQTKPSNQPTNPHKTISPTNLPTSTEDF